MSWLIDSVHYDCRYYIGEKPCAFKEICHQCTEYSPMGKRVLIIKLGAMGDVLRTTPLLRSILKQPGNHHITWIAEKVSAPLFVHNDMVDRVWTAGWEIIPLLLNERFDVLYCLDKEPKAIAVAAIAKATEKYGFIADEKGNLHPANPEADYAFLLGLHDYMKFEKNEKSYQQIMFEACKFTFSGEEYVFNLTSDEAESGRRHLKKRGVGSHKAIGVNTSAGEVFATKRWSKNATVKAIKLIKDMDMTPVLLGGPEEILRNAEILKEAGNGVVDAGCDNSLRHFASIIAALDAIIVTDSLAMHLAIAAKTPIVALFGPTCPREVELYGLGEKVVSSPDCAPCYKSSCDHHKCMEEITPEAVVATLKRVLESSSK